MKRFLAILLACAATASAQTYITVTAETNRAIRTNFSLVRSQVSDLSGATYAISNITALQTTLDGKLATNGSAAGLSNFPASLLTTNSSESLFPSALLRTNGSAGALTNFPASLLQTNSSDGSFPLFLLRTNGSASALTNFPASVLLTNSATASFPSFLLRTNGDGSALTNLPNANLSNAVGVLPIANGGTGATNEAGARTAFGLGSAATNPASAFQPASSALTNLAANNGGSLTNLAYSNSVGFGSAATNDASAFQPASANLTNLANNDAAALTNFPANVLLTNSATSAFPSFLLRTNGDASGLSNVLPVYSNNAGKVLAVAAGATNVEWIAVSNTVTDASALTNYPSYLLQTNSANALFPVFLARTNANGAGFTNLAISNVVNLQSVLDSKLATNGTFTGTASNVTGVVSLFNGGTGATSQVTALVNLGILSSTNAGFVGTNPYTVQIGGGISPDVYGAVQIGAQTLNGSQRAVVIGYGAEGGTNNPATAVGHLAKAYGGYSVAIGSEAEASNSYSFQIGNGTNTTAYSIQVMSAGAVTTNTWSALANSTSIGKEIMQAPTNGTNGQALIWTNNDVAWATVSGTANLTNVTNTLGVANGGTGGTNMDTALKGLGVYASTFYNTVDLSISPTYGVAEQSVRIGFSADGRAQGATAIGAYAEAVNLSSTAIGYDAFVSGGTNVALGASARATAANAVQLGAGTNGSTATIQFGSAGSVGTNSWNALANSSTQGRYAMTNTNGISGTKTFVAYDGTNYSTNSVTISNGIITGWTP